MTKKILIVDDEPDMLAVIAIRLKRWGYGVAYAASGAEAFKKIKKEKPGLILLDLALPDMRGDNICLKVKSSAKTSSVPVVVISAVMENLEARAKSCGADDCLLKPYEASALLKKIERFFPREKAKPLMGGELKDIKKIAPDYISHKKEDLKKISESVKNGDFEEIKVLAHRMKGSGKMYGFEELSMAGAAMEAASAAKDTKELRRLCRELKKKLGAMG